MNKEDLLAASILAYDNRQWKAEINVFLLIVRSNANPPIDENNEKDKNRKDNDLTS